MSNLENYMKQQAIFCEQNDSISKNLYSEYGKYVIIRICPQLYFSDTLFS